MLDEHIDVDFVDVNMGCPIDIVCNRYLFFLASLAYMQLSPTDQMLWPA